MKKFMMIAATAALFASCSDKNDNLFDNEFEAAQLGITAGVSVSQGVTRVGGASAGITNFATGDQLGICVFEHGRFGTAYAGGQNHLNIASTFDGSKWSLANDFWLASSIGQVYAYYPYSAALGTASDDAFQINAIPVTSGDVDFMRGNCIQNLWRNNTAATVHMDHALAKLTFAITVNNFPAADGTAPVLSNITIANAAAGTTVATTATMSLANGVMADRNTASHVAFDQTITLSSTASKLETLVIPTAAITVAEQVVFNFTVDGTIYSQTVTLTAAGGINNWSAGDNYVYNVNLSGQGLSIGEVTIQPWNVVAGGDIELN